MDILIYIEKALCDEDLVFMNTFLPEYLALMLKGLNNSTKVFYSAPVGYSGRLKGSQYFFQRERQDDVEFWKDIFSRSGSDHLCKINAESALCDGAVILEMIDLHLKYLAEFTFSENLPAGFSCEIVSKELIESIPDFNEKTLPLSQVVKANINQFDIELYYKEPDIRDKRISFLIGNRREKRIMENIFSVHKKNPAYSEIKGVIEKNPEVLYVAPSYLEIELTGACDLSCLFCYRTALKEAHGNMDAGLSKKIFEQMGSFQLPYAVCFGGSGEPMMHPKFYEILTQAQNEPLVESVIVETNGLYADANYRNFILNTGLKISTIVNCNGMNAETYEKLHGRDCFDRVRDNVLSLNEAAAGRLYIQIMKIKETEPFTDAYYDYWEKYKIPIIFQKQNTYLGRVEDRRYSDLSPLERVPCWHLQRDLYVLSDGTVSFCKQDVEGACSKGNINKETVQALWQKKKENFINDYNKSYPAAPDCKSCDEWYTFNI